MTTREPAGAVAPPRIPPVEELDDSQREAMAKTPGGVEDALNVFKTLAHAPKLLRRVNSLGGYFVVHGSIPLREREIVILRTAAAIRCDYELAHHRLRGAEAGLTEEEIRAATDPGFGHEWAEADRALVAFVDELLEDDRVSEEAWDALEAAHGDVGRLELLVLVGHYRLLGGMLNTVGVEIDA